MPLLAPVIQWTPENAAPSIREPLPLPDTSLVYKICIGCVQGGAMAAKSSGAGAAVREAPVYPIREVARATGVAPVTLRAWERRYGLLRPRRTPKGHRLYAQADVERVRRILRLVERGVPVSQVRGVLDGRGPAAIAAPVSGSGFAPLREALVAAAGRLAPAAFDGALAQGLAELPLDALWCRVLEPARAQLRAAAERGAAPAAARAFFAARAGLCFAALVGQRVQRRPAPRTGVWLQGLPGDWDALGVLVHAWGCLEAGVEAVPVTAPLPLEGLAAVAEAGATAIVLVGRAVTLEAADERALAGLGATESLPRLVAGAAAATGGGGEVFAELGFEALPSGPAAAAAVIARRIRSAAGAPAA